MPDTTLDERFSPARSGHGAAAHPLLRWRAVDHQSRLPARDALRRGHQNRANSVRGDSHIPAGDGRARDGGNSNSAWAPNAAWPKSNFASAPTIPCARRATNWKCASRQRTTALVEARVPLPRHLRERGRGHLSNPCPGGGFSQRQSRVRASARLRHAGGAGRQRARSPPALRAARRAGRVRAPPGGRRAPSPTWNPKFTAPMARASGSPKTPAPFTTAKAALLRYEGTAEDITARRRSEEALHLAHEELEERVRERTAELGAAQRQPAPARRPGASHAEASARRSESKFSRAHRETPQDLTSIVTPDGVLVYNTPSIEHILGFTPDDLLGEKHFSRACFIPPTGKKAGRTSTASSQPAPATCASEYRLRPPRTAPGGGWKASPPPLPPGFPLVGVVVNSRDITERRRSEREGRRRARASRPPSRNSAATPCRGWSCRKIFRAHGPASWLQR